MDPFSMSNPSFFEGGGGRHYYYFLLVFRGTEKQLIHFPFPIHYFLGCVLCLSVALAAQANKKARSFGRFHSRVAKLV